VDKKLAKQEGARIQLSESAKVVQLEMGIFKPHYFHRHAFFFLILCLVFPKERYFSEVFEHLEKHCNIIDTLEASEEDPEFLFDTRPGVNGKKYILLYHFIFTSIVERKLDSKIYEMLHPL